MLLVKKVCRSENHLKGILFYELSYSRLTELVMPFGDLFLKVADFQFKYIKKRLEKEKKTQDILWQ